MSDGREWYDKLEKPKDESLSGMRVETFSYLNGEIEQNVMNGARLLTKHILNTKDEQVRAHLIKLGWTPPPP